MGKNFHSNGKTFILKLRSGFEEDFRILKINLSTGAQKFRNEHKATTWTFRFSNRSNCCRRKNTSQKNKQEQ